MSSNLFEIFVQYEILDLVVLYVIIIFKHELSKHLTKTNTELWVEDGLWLAVESRT